MLCGCAHSPCTVTPLNRCTVKGVVAENPVHSFVNGDIGEARVRLPVSTWCLEPSAPRLSRMVFCDHGRPVALGKLVAIEEFGPSPLYTWAWRRWVFFLRRARSPSVRVAMSLWGIANIVARFLA